MREELADFIFVLAFILVGPVVWFFFDLGTAIAASLVVSMMVVIIYTLAMMAFKLGDRKDNRNRLIALLVYLALFLVVFLFDA